MAASATAAGQFLITGASGQLGHALRGIWSEDANDVSENGRLIAKPRESFDIADEALVQEWLPTLMPSVVINCAGYTHVSRAEQDREACWRSNVAGVANLASVCAEHDIPLVHISTDFIYGQDYSHRYATAANSLDDDERLPSASEIARRLAYRDTCAPGPMNYYGQTKLAAEHVILRQASESLTFRYWIIRTSGLFERPWRATRNFPLAIASKLYRQRTPIEVVSDVHTNVTSAEDLAAAIAWMLDHRNKHREGGLLCPRGIYHIANEGAASWYDIAKTLAGHLGQRDRIIPTTSQKYAESQGVRNQTPKYSCMDMSKYRKTGGPVMPTWQAAIARWAEQAKEYFS
jgi:dTDP-4-dehydrorhamnose reductase